MLPFFEPDHLILRERTRRWVEEKGLSFSRHHGNLAERAIALVRELGAGGFLKHAVSEEFGGIRATVQARDLCVLREELARGDALADTMFAMQALGSYPISLAGNREQKSRLLPASRTRRMYCEPSLSPSPTLVLTWRPCKLARCATEMNSA